MLSEAQLYDWVRDLPIVDWHNHLDLATLEADRPLGSLYEVWVKADPYKHRAMRICGEPEELITGNARHGQDARGPVNEAERWAAWMRTLPKLVGNPIFAWAKMELEFLGLDPEPYLHGWGENASLAAWTPSKLLKAFNVETLCPCVGKLGQRASRPLGWTAASLRSFVSSGEGVADHLSHTLASGVFHRRSFPHIAQDSTLVFVTFRLNDSLPASKLAELEEFRADWLRDHPEPWDEATRREWARERLDRIDAWLDLGHGSCILADPDCRAVVEGALEYFNDTTGPTGVSPVGTGEGERHGQDARGPGEDVSPAVRPSLRLNAGEAVSGEELARFQEAGCRVVDISVDDTASLEAEFDTLLPIAAFAAAHGWTLLLHLGALRETSARLRALAGPAGGFAGMRAPVDPADVARFLDRLEKAGPTGSLPRTVLLSLNPGAHAQLAVLAGSFNGAGMPGKVQLGPAWWWCDHEEGIRDVLEKNAAYGVLSAFVGMTTDSRSLLSFVRHDYFRRILCRWTAEKIASGAFPDDEALVRPMLEKVCCFNAREMMR